MNWHFIQYFCIYLSFPIFLTTNTFYTWFNSNNTYNVPSNLYLSFPPNYCGFVLFRVHKTQACLLLSIWHFSPSVWVLKISFWLQVLHQYYDDHQKHSSWRKVDKRNKANFFLSVKDTKRNQPLPDAHILLFITLTFWKKSFLFLTYYS